LTPWRPYTEEERSTLIIDREDQLEYDPERAIRERYQGIDRLLI